MKKSKLTKKKLQQIVQSITHDNKTTRDILEVLSANPDIRDYSRSKPMHPWSPSDGVVFPKVVKNTKVSFKNRPITREKLEIPSAEPLIEQFPKPSELLTHDDPCIYKSPKPDADDMHVTSQKIRARHGDLDAQKYLTDRFGPMNDDWSSPLPHPMTFWQRFIYLFTGKSQ